VCHIAFLRICKLERILPKGLRCFDKLSNTFPCEESKDLSERHSRQYLNLLIQKLYGDLKKMQATNLNGPLTHADTLVLNKVRAKSIALKVKKLTNLMMEREVQIRTLHSEHNVVPTTDAFTNLSNVGFSKDELELLQKGPSYAPPSHITRTDRIEIETKIDYVASKLPSHIPKYCISEFSGVVKRIISEKEGQREKQALETLKSIRTHDVVIAHSDKSKKLIAVDPSHYSRMKGDHVSNLEEKSLILPSTAQAKFNSGLKTIARKYSGDLQTTLLRCSCSEPLPSKMKVLPKDHKDGCLRGRPIIAALDGPANRLSHYLAMQLMRIVKLHVPSYIGSTAEFLEIIKSFNMSNDFRFASLDVVNLYGSIPLNDTSFPGAFSIVTEFFEQHKTDCDMNAVSAEDFRSLLSLSITSDVIQVDNKIYKMEHGVQMGNSVSCPVAIIFMNYIESEILKQFGSKIKLWKRFIDDIFVVYEEISDGDLLSVSNGVDPSISFTFEPPIDGSLAFLDVMLHASGCLFTYTLHVKPSRSSHVIPWNSHHPRSLLRNIVCNEMRRAIRNGSGPSEIAQGVSLLEKKYLSNGYPISVIQNAIRKAKQPLKAKETGPRKLYLSLPYRSERSVREIRRCLNKTQLNDFIRVNFISKPLHRILLNNRESPCLQENCIWCKQEHGRRSCMSKFCVYLIKCIASPNCSAEYVGETQRTMRARLKEHVSVDTSHVQQHLVKVHGRAGIELISWSVLHRDLRNFVIRKKIEAQQIALRRPIINVQQR
jgi:hypothetical protein